MAETYIGGFHAVRALLERGDPRPLELLLADSRNDARARDLRSVAARAGVPLRVIARAELDLRAPGVRHQGVLALVETAHLADEDLLNVPAESGRLLLALDRVQDPHNLGACLRAAEAFGVSALVVPKDHAAGLTPVARMVSVGASERIPLVAVTNLSRTLERLQSLGYWVVGLAGEAREPVYAVDFTGPVVIVAGAEAQGLRRLTREHCDRLVHIPMCGQIESLNVSVAVGVCLYEAMRQRMGGRSK